MKILFCELLDFTELYTKTRKKSKSKTRRKSTRKGQRRKTARRAYTGLTVRVRKRGSKRRQTRTDNSWVF